MFHVSSAVRESTAGPQQQQQQAGVGPINWSLKQSTGEVRHKRNPQVSDHNLELKTVVHSFSGHLVVYISTWKPRSPRPFQ